MTGKWVRHEVGALLSRGALEIGDGYRAKNAELSKSGIPFARASNINNGFRFADVDYFPLERLSRVGNKVSQPGDVVFTSKGTVGRFAFVRPETPRFVYSPQLCFWRSCDAEIIYPRFLFYWMLGREFFVQVQGVAGQTDMAEYVSLTDQRRMHITLPPIKDQRAIAHVLGVLDDKIELNERMNETLEAMARAVFKDWFVDFGPVRAKAEGRPSGLPPDLDALFPASFEASELGEIPAGWEVKALGDVTESVRGRSYRSAELAESDTALVTLKSFARGGGYRPEGLKPYTGKHKPAQVVGPGELVIACTDVTQAAEVIGRPAIVPADQRFTTLVASLDTLIIRPRDAAAPVPFLYCLTSEPSFTQHTYAHVSGTTVLHLSKEAVPAFKFALPPSDLMRAFVGLAGPAFKRMADLSGESASTAAQRDALLPRLVSGEVRVGAGPHNTQ